MAARRESSRTISYSNRASVSPGDTNCRLALQNSLKNTKIGGAREDRTPDLYNAMVVGTRPYSIDFQRKMGPPTLCFDRLLLGWSMRDLSCSRKIPPIDEHGTGLTISTKVRSKINA